MGRAVEGLKIEIRGNVVVNAFQRGGWEIFFRIFNRLIFVVLSTDNY